MIRRLRKRFIRIAMLSFTIVLLMLLLIVNTANILSTDSDLTGMLDMICENQGVIPAHIPPFGAGGGFDGRRDLPDEGPGGAPGGRVGPFGPETPYVTRFFCLWFDGRGDLDRADLEHIAAITADETGEYIARALSRGVGYGYYSGYKYRVVRHGEDRYMAVFLDCYQELRAVRTVAACSLLAAAACLAMVYLLVVLFSKRAIDPVVCSAERQKQFITDAGHELKTPITVIATSLKVLEMEVGGHKWIEKSKTQTERLRDLVNSLVTLSRMDEEAFPLKFEPFPISEAVEETVESFLDFARSEGRELLPDITPGLVYCGDEYAVRQLVSILLDNAIKYATAGTAVSLSLKKGKRGVVIRSVNRCEPVSPDDLDKLFDRFYRTEQARGTSAGGFGVGLSIARGIAQGHRGSIRAGCPSDGVIEFTVELR